MRIKLLAALIPASIVLSGCALNGGNNTGEQDLIRACELVNSRSASEETFIPNVAIEFFASAARTNNENLLLLQAAKMSQLPPFGYGNQPALTAEIIKARTLVVGYCTPRLAK